jgi:imidazolonepropionase-like amidohydrolase
VPDVATAISNVRVFDGESIGRARTVFVDNGLIVADSPVTQTFDGAGGVLLPGLIDAHVHVEDRSALEQLLTYGVTTVLDMASPRPQVTDALRAVPGLPQVLCAGLPASAPGGLHTKRMGFPPSSAVTGPADAARFVSDRVADGSDYVKIIVEDPRMPRTADLPLDTISALVLAAHAAGLKAIAHAVTSTAVRLASDAGVDVITHAPVNRSLTADEALALASRGAALIPTLTMMRGTAETIGRQRMFRVLRRLNIAPPVEYANARASVAVSVAAGLTVIAGTDANVEPGAPWHPAYGSALHEELALLVDAGLTPVEAIAAATKVPAEFFGLRDRGAITVGRRADLMLVDDDPTDDIALLRNVRAVWLGGDKVR